MAQALLPSDIRGPSGLDYGLSDASNVPIWQQRSLPLPNWNTAKIQGEYWDTIGYYRDNGKENGNYCLGLRGDVYSERFCVLVT